MSTFNVGWLNVVGLLFDLVGAIVLASGLILNQDTAIQRAVDSRRFASEIWEENKKLSDVRAMLRQSRHALIGVVFLTIGFLLQIVGNWPT